MLFLNLIAFVGLAFLAAFSVALPQPAFEGGLGPRHGPFRRPGSPRRGPSSSATLVDPTFPGPTGISGSPTFPTGGYPTGIPAPGTATNRLPVVPFPTIAVEDEILHEKRFGGPRGHGPSKPWYPYKPSPNKPSRLVTASQSPPFATGGPIASGTQGPPILGQTGGPGGPPSPVPTQH